MPERRLDVDDPNWGLANHFKHELVRTSIPSAAERKGRSRGVTTERVVDSAGEVVHDIDCAELAHQIVASQDAARARALTDSFKHRCEDCGRPVLRDRRRCQECRDHVDHDALEQHRRDLEAVFTRRGLTPPWLISS